MADEPKVPPEARKANDKPASADQPAAAEKPSSPAAGAGPTGGPAAPVNTQSPAAKPPAGAGTPPAKPAAPPKPAAKPVVKAEPWTSPLAEALQKKFPGVVSEAVIFRNQPSVTVARESLLSVCEFLRSDDGGAYTVLTDETAVDYPKRPKRFEIIYQLYSFKGNHRLRLKVLAGEGEKVPSVTGIWPAANWLEREVFDMFGVVYEGHPDLKRILLPEDWTGHPLRKDADILRQDEAWVQSNLGIKSGQ